MSRPIAKPDFTSCLKDMSFTDSASSYSADESDIETSITAPTAPMMIAEKSTATKSFWPPGKSDSR